MDTTTTDSTPGTTTRTTTSAAGRLLLLAAGAQLGTALVGQAVAVRRGLPVDIAALGLRPRLPPGPASSRRVARDAWVTGTALSAPVPALLLQGGALAVLARHPAPAPAGRSAALVLGVQAAVACAGQPAERLGRVRLVRGSTDPVETPVVVLGTVLAAAVVALSAVARRP
ncbi:hypothetical protein FHN55_17415 [Streptomyces sp. NP160]|uniref:hypothetical protein n=1 Tax=Streptomyces sp. NP160 TaxID=2586637 RepID=UPI00111BB01C|nr:hypothetical protein [Streptomyces sp. NP160]TNM61129.1 hypothetical protein FHN55_17415 [Streptomyces sp. NP160]